jgi:hypothetical protein
MKDLTPMFRCDPDVPMFSKAGLGMTADEKRAVADYVFSVAPGRM